MDNTKEIITVESGHDTVFSFQEALYDCVCCKCNSELWWEADFDADGTNYYASCCNIRYRMTPNTVTVSAYEDENEDEENVMSVEEKEKDERRINMIREALEKGRLESMERERLRRVDPATLSDQFTL